MILKAASPDAYRLLHEGTLALARMEHNGIKIDTEYLHSAMRDVSAKIAEYENELKKDEIYKAWHRRFRDRTKLGSKEQLAHMIFMELGYKCRDGFKVTGVDPRQVEGMKLSDVVKLAEKDKRIKIRPKAEETSFAHLVNKVPFLKLYFENAKLEKLKSTYLSGIVREISNGRIHGNISLHLVISFRSSMGEPNLQNIPIRNKKIGTIIRQAFIPDDDCHLVELDYGRIEVHAGTWYHKDPTMLKYLHDPTTDMHRDMAFQIYKFKEKDVDKGVFKAARYGAKNKFVFPQFYGDYYKSCSRHLWEWIDGGDLKMLNGASFKDKFKGLGSLKDGTEPEPGTFAHHIKEIERHFWNVRFPVYTDWKKKLYASYLDRGWIETIHGFAIQGIYKKNEILNLPIQGLAFHCLLWSLIRIDKELRRRKMKTKLVLQIHDALLASVPRKELQDYIYLARSIMIDELTKAWKFICTPLEVEPEVSPFEMSWHHKEKYVEVNGKWQPESKK